MEAEGERVLLLLDAVRALPRLRSGPPQEGVVGTLRLLQGPEDLILQWEPHEEPGEPPEDEDEPPDPGFEPDWAVLSPPPRHPPSPGGPVSAFRLGLGELRGLRRGPPGLGPPLLVLLPRGGPCPPPLLLPRGGQRRLLRMLGGRLRPCPRDPRLLLVGEDSAPPPDPPSPGLVTRLLQAPYAATVGGLSRLLGGRGQGAGPGAGPEQEAEPPFEVITCVTLGPRPSPPRGPPVTLEEWGRGLDGEGRSLDPQGMRQRIFRGGLTPEARPEAWPRLLGLRAWGGARDPDGERDRRASYQRMRLQWRSLSPEQERRNRVLRGYRNRMERDLGRCPPEVPVATLREVLLTFCMYNFDLGYVRGMAELLAPLVAACPPPAEAFWGFCHLMEAVGENFGPTREGLRRQRGLLGQLLRVLEPGRGHPPAAASRWLQLRFLPRFGLGGSQRLCEVLWTRLPCPNFHLVLACAILGAERDRGGAGGGNGGGTDDGDSDSDGDSDGEQTPLVPGPPLDADLVLSRAEGILLQLMAAQELPLPLRDLLGLGPPPGPPPSPPPGPAPPEDLGAPPESGGGAGGGPEPKLKGRRPPDQ